MSCVGCGQPTDGAPVHVETSAYASVHPCWHHDCHANVTGCALCSAVVAAYPEQKNEALSEALVSAPHPFTQES